MRVFTLIVASLSSIVLAGCGAIPFTQQQAQTDDQGQVVAKSSTPATKADTTKQGPEAKTPQATHYVFITPFTELNRYDCVQQLQTSSKPSAGNANANASNCVGFDTRFAGAYTRLIIYGLTASPPAPGGSSSINQASGDSTALLPYSSRSFLARKLFGVHRSITLTAKVNVGSFAATVPLVTIDHVSNDTSGESFSRAIYHRAENYPLFLVKRDLSNGIIAAQFVVKASNETESSAAGATLGLIQSVANFVAPPASVLTTLTAQSTKNVATALDQSISKLFATTIDEEQWFDDDVRRWGNRVSITFKIPDNDGDWTASPNRTIGEWTVAFANPRPSIFSDVEICPPNATQKVRCGSNFAEAAAGAEYDVQKSPDQVLSFHLVGNQSNLDTIQKYLLQQDWYQKNVTAMAKASDNSADLREGTTSFCRSIRSAIAGLGLNDVDAGIVVVAARNGLDLPQKIIDRMGSDTDNCSYVYAPVQLP